MESFALKLTGGYLRGRVLKVHVPTHCEVRPTQVKLRQALFHAVQAVLGSDFAGMRVLDLFSGSGALGFEALSRGAQEVHFVENAASIADCIRDNAKQLGVLHQVKIHCQSVQSFLKNQPTQYHLMIADPPYHQNWKFNLLQWSAWVVRGGLFCLEYEVQESLEEIPLDDWIQIREKNYGRTLLTIYQRREA